MSRFASVTSPLRRILVSGVLDRPWLCLAVTGGLTLVLAAGLPRLELRTDGAALHPSGNQTVERTLSDRYRFVEREQVIVLMTSRPDGPAVESRRGLEALRDLHASLAALPSVDRRRPRSLATLLDPDPGLPFIMIREFLREIPEDAEGLAALLDRAHGFRLARGLYLSPDGRAAAIYVPVAEQTAPRLQLVAELEAWLDVHTPADFDVRLTGPAVAEATLGDAVLRDLAWLVPLMVLAIAGLLFFSLRTPGGVLIPLAEVLVVLIWTLGAMGHLGIPVTLVTTILPVILMTMAVTDEIHLLERFQVRLAEEGSLTDPSGRMRAAIAGAIEDVGRPIVLTSLTTAAGFTSFLTASMAPIRDFGVFTALGILLAMVLSFSFVPALVLMLSPRFFEARTSAADGERRLPGFERVVVRRPGVAALLAVALVLAALPGLPRLRVQDAWVDNFAPDSDLVAAESDFNRQFWGSYRFDVVLTASEEDFFRSGPGFRLIEELRQLAQDAPHVGGVLTHLLPFEVIMTIEGKSGSFSELAADQRKRIAGLVEMIAHRIDLDQVRIHYLPVARLRLFVPSSDYRKGAELREHLERELPEALEGRSVLTYFSGDLPVAMEIVAAVVDNQLRSLAWALAGVAVLLLLALRSLRGIVIVLAPVVAALTIVFGFMGHAGIALGVATSMFGALCIGVGVDFAVHMTHAHSRARRQGNPPEAAAEAMFRSSGRAIRWNAVVLGLGFLVLTLSALRPNHSLGLLLAAAMGASYLASLLLVPWLLGQREA